MKIYPNLLTKKIDDIYDWILKVTQYRAQDVTDNDTMAADIQTAQTDITALQANLTLPAPGANGNELISNGSIWTSAAPPAAAAPPWMAIGGLIISAITGTSTTAGFSLSAGAATDKTGAVQISVASPLAWLASNGNAINGTDAGSSTLANSTTYHVFICTGASGTGCFVSASLTPTFPTGYAVSSRRVGSFLTTAAGAPIPYKCRESSGGGTRCRLTTQTLDQNGAATTAISRLGYVVNVPSGIVVQWVGRADSHGSSTSQIIWTDFDETDVAPATAMTTVPGYDMNFNVSSQLGVGYYLFTDTASKIYARSGNVALLVDVITRGWNDDRRS